MTKVNQETFKYTIRAFVNLGLLNFWLHSLPEDQKIVPLLKISLDESCVDCFDEKSRNTNNPSVDDLARSWVKLKDSVAQQLESMASTHPLARLYKRYRLKISDIFVLSLLGEMESSHLVNMVISELQAPDKQARPSIHTVESILMTLFEKNEIQRDYVLDFSNQGLAKEGWLEVCGEGPLPLRKLKIQPVVWQLLLGFNGDWPGCKPISVEQEKFLGKINRDGAQKMALLFGKNERVIGEDRQNKILLVRGTPNSGRCIFTSLVAAGANLQAKLFPVDLWNKTKILAALCPFMGWLPVLKPNLGPAEALELNHSTERMVVLLGNEGTVESENLFEYQLDLPSPSERLQMWNECLDNTNLSNQLATSTLLSGRQIKKLGESAVRIANAGQPISLKEIFEARKLLASEKLRLLAQQEFREISRESLVLPEFVLQSLDHILLRARKRERICEGLGVTLAATANAGVRGLLVGESGTGKTLAASYIATELGAPLYRVDLASVMNKYIGESEKNLGLLLDQAAANDVVLLFDEADSLFGKRSEGKETGERFANMLTNFLLTRIENHPGVVLLTTNSEERIDTAFNRRIDMVVNFPVPGYSERLALWQCHLGDKGPGNAIYQMLASYSDLTGGQIRNAVLAAATLSQGPTIECDTLVEGIKLEYSKIGRKLPGKLQSIAS